MRRNELDKILTAMLDSTPIAPGKTRADARKDVSDLIFTVRKPLQVEHAGQLMPVVFDPPLGELTPYQTEMIA